MSSKQDIQKDRGHANSPMSPDSSSDKILGGPLSFIDSSRLSDSHGGTRISVPVTQLNPVPGTSAVLGDSFSGDPTLGLINHVQRVPNDTSSTPTNEANHTKARDHGHNTDPKAQVPNAKCV
ncbi:hypothetical protein EDD18DRAFT_1370216 [Armillaria luteobubalina]|uniref:Uncharacterized protein n=1 Tax=Armillaria luteobubalina TaxID=153913 RepID=A0AA39NVG6_9AGAR|nr:hypothetical protein EDD18DRAFT_1370216 [Armillaria luteobubalina]